jgi:quinol monooxygenase YgiN
MTMVIIAGHSTVDAADRDRYVTAHQDLVRRARPAPGCLDVAITADPLDPARVNVFEGWESRDHLDAWRAVANAPRSKIKLGSVDVMMYVVSDVRPPFGGRRLHSAPDVTRRRAGAR